MMMFWASLITSIIWSHCCWSNCRTATNSKCPEYSNRPHLAKNSCSARIFSINSTNGANQLEGNCKGSVNSYKTLISDLFPFLDIRTPYYWNNLNCTSCWSAIRDISYSFTNRSCGHCSRSLPRVRGKSSRPILTSDL